MKKLFTLFALVAASCTITESAGWIQNLLLLRSANFAVAPDGTITIDGFTYTLHSVQSVTTAVYNVFIGEYSEREDESIGFVRFDIVDAALTDAHIGESLIRYQIANTPEEALRAPRLNSNEVIDIPPTVASTRFLRSMQNITQRALITNGTSLGQHIDIQVHTAAEYIRGVVTTDGQNIFFQEYKITPTGNVAGTLPNPLFLDQQWRFVGVLSSTQGIYQKVTVAFADPGEGFFSDAGNWPKKGGALDSVSFIGVERRSDGIYFFFPESGPNKFFLQPSEVTFSGYSVRVSRPLINTDL